MAARTFSLYTFLLAIVLALGACKKDDFANETMTELGALTDDIVKKVKDADDKLAGLAEAQRALDAKKDDLSAKLKEIGALREFQISEEAQGNVAKGILDASNKMQQLEFDLLIASMKDKELDAAVKKLSADHQAIIKAFAGEA